MTLKVTRLSYSTLWGSPELAATALYTPFTTNAQARAARDAKSRELIKEGFEVKRSTLSNQLRKYWSFSVGCGQTCNCYEIYIKETSQ